MAYVMADVKCQTRTCVQVPETLPQAVLEKMHSPPKPDVPIIDVHDLASADGYVFAFPTR